MKTRILKSTLGLALVLLSTTSTLAQSGGAFAIRSSVIAGGGGTSTGRVFAVTGSLGQPVAGGASGGTFSVQSGFWSVVQAPGAPVLRVVRTGANSAVVSWPAPSTGWVGRRTEFFG